MTNEYWDDNDGQDAVNVDDFDNCSVRLTQMPKHMGQHQPIAANTKENSAYIRP